MDDIAYFADALVVTSENAREPHWDASAKDLIGGLISYVMEMENMAPESKTLKTMRDLLNLPEAAFGGQPSGHGTPAVPG